MTLQIEFCEGISSVFIFLITNPSIDRKVLINLIINIISSLRPYQITFECAQIICLVVHSTGEYLTWDVSIGNLQ